MKNEQPLLIWAEDKTLPFDPTKNGYWEGRNIPSSKVVEYILKDHRDETVRVLENDVGMLLEYLSRVKNVYSLLDSSEEDVLDDIKFRYGDYNEQ